jgi:transposase
VIRSPYDADARSSKKRERIWLGYKVHLTETCAGDAPHLIVDVQTTPACVPDVEMTASIQQALDERELVPSEQLVDSGYVDAELLVSSQERYGITLIGPALADNSWQAKASQGFAAAHFQIDWEHHQVTCPQGQVSYRWVKTKGRIEVCTDRASLCPLRSRVPPVPARKRPGESSTCGRKRPMPPYMRAARNSSQQLFARFTPTARALKERWRKGCVAPGCARRAIAGCATQRCSMS